jgi:hypothetical protein
LAIQMPDGFMDDIVSVKNVAQWRKPYHRFYK